MDLISSYHAAIDHVLLTSGMTDKMAHVQVGLAIYVTAQLVFRTRRGSIDALLAVIIAEALNEAMDRLFFGSWRWDDTLGDVSATLFWPTTMVLVSKFRRAHWAAKHRRFTGAERINGEVLAKQLAVMR